MYVPVDDSRRLDYRWSKRLTQTRLKTNLPLARPCQGCITHWLVIQQIIRVSLHIMCVQGGMGMSFSDSWLEIHSKSRRAN